MIFFRLLNRLAILLAFVTIGLGAYTRLTDAGLGCPDWPGCYGAVIAPKNPEQVSVAQAVYPLMPVNAVKAATEMLHRYLAGSLVVCVLVLTSYSWRFSYQRKITSFLLVLILIQALLGMLTVNYKLMPLTVLGHLLGGFLLFGFLVVLHQANSYPIAISSTPVFLRLLAWGAMIILIIQILLGGWTSSNYAGLACHQLPLCEPGWQQHFNVESAFSLPLHQATYHYGVLSIDARISIHILHRVGALMAGGALGILSMALWRHGQLKVMAVVLMLLVAVQISLGVINVLMFLPLVNAVLHTLVAACLFCMLLVVLHRFHANDFSDFGNYPPEAI